MKSAPKHAAPRAAKHRRGGRHRRRQPFRPSFALKAMAAGIFLTVGSLSTVAASAPPATSHARRRQPPLRIRPPPTRPPPVRPRRRPRLRPLRRPRLSHDHSARPRRPPPRRHRPTPLPPRLLRWPHQLAADPTIVVHAGGVRAGNTTTVAPLPDGAVFTATEVGGTGATFTCTTSGGTGTCSIAGLPAGHAVGCDRNHSAARLLPEPDPRLRDQFVSQLLPVHVPHRSVERHHDRRCARSPPAEWYFPSHPSRPTGNARYSARRWRLRLTTQRALRYAA